MSSWDSNPWSNFCDPHWEFICCKKWHPGTSEVPKPPEIAVGTHFHAHHDTKTILVFLPAVGEASWLLIPSLVSLLSGGTVQLENTYSCILKVTGQVWENQKTRSINTSITATTSVHLPRLVSTDLTITSNSVLINPIGKDEVREWSMSKTSVS